MDKSKKVASLQIDPEADTLTHLEMANNIVQTSTAIPEVLLDSPNHLGNIILVPVLTEDDKWIRNFMHTCKEDPLRFN